MDSQVRGVHDLLVAEAAAYLRRVGCVVVVTENTVGYGEAPDAMGWVPVTGYRGEAPGQGLVTLDFQCHVIECKASRSDLLADRNKLARLNGSGLGVLRWYLTAPDVVVDPESDLAPGWGWYLYSNGSIIEKRRPTPMASNVAGERHHLISACRHLAAARRGAVTCKAYRFENAGRTTISVEAAEEPPKQESRQLELMHT